MNSDVVNEMLRGRKEKIRSYVLVNLSIILNHGYNYKWICIVEGKTDVPFYSNISNINLQDKTRYLFNYRTKDTVPDLDVGKDAVIGSYNMIRKNPKFNLLLKKCIFIIDYDYDGAKSMKYNYDQDRESKMSITPGHSYENMFLEEDNVKIIFDYFGKTDNDRLKFEEKYCQFIKDSAEFFRLKSSLIEVKKKGTVCYDYYAKSYSTNLNISEDIFKFNFDNMHYNSDYFNKNIMYRENQKMNRFINSFENKSALMFYQKYSKDIVYNRNFVRGHEAMNFLKSYFRDIFGIELKDNPANDLYKDIVRLLKIRMTFVNGLGEKIVNLGNIKNVP